jgi:hypothetical protein
MHGPGRWVAPTVRHDGGTPKVGWKGNGAGSIRSGSDVLRRRPRVVDGGARGRDGGRCLPRRRRGRRRLDDHDHLRVDDDHDHLRVDDDDHLRVDDDDHARVDDDV